MESQSVTFIVQWVREETTQMRLISLNGKKIWTFIPGQVAVLGMGDVGESYFAIASAPEDRDGMEFLIRKGQRVSEALFTVKKGGKVRGKGPLGKGFPVDQYLGRDLILAAVGSAIAPMRSVLRSIVHRRSTFGNVVLVYGTRQPQDFPFLDEMENWQQARIKVILTSSRPEGREWRGKTGYVQAHFAEALVALQHPVAMVCGMKAMIEQSRDALIRLGLVPNDILTNY